MFGAAALQLRRPGGGVSGSFSAGYAGYQVWVAGGRAGAANSWTSFAKSLDAGARFVVLWDLEQLCIVESGESFPL